MKGATEWNLIVAKLYVFNGSTKIQYSEPPRTEDELMKALEHQKMVREWKL